MSEKYIQFELITPERKVISKEVAQISLPTQEGEITVLPGHIALVAILVPGELRVLRDDQEDLVAVSGGFIEVQPNKVTVLADTAERAEEIDEQRAEEALERAKKIVAEKSDDVELYVAQLEKEFARIRVVRRRKKYKNIK